MSDVATVKQTVKYSELQESVAKFMKLDADKVTDEHISNALTQFCDEMGRKALEMTGDSDATDVVLKNVDFGEARDAVLANAEERRATKNIGSERDPKARLPKVAEEAGKGVADVWMKVQKAGTIMHALRLQESATPRYLLETPTSDPKIKAIQRFNDDMMLLSMLMGRRTGITMEGQPRESDSELFAGFESMDTWREFKKYSPEWAKAMNETGNSAWVPTFYSPDFIETVYQTTNVMGRLRRIDFPRGQGGTMAIPVEGSDLHAYGAGEATSDDDAAKYTASTPGSGTSVTVTPKTLAVRTVLSLEMEEDSIVPALDHARTKVLRAFALDLDDAIINGDATATHHDTDVVAANDRRHLWTGYVEKALTDSSANVSMSTNYNYEYLMAPLLNMGPYNLPGETVLVVSHEFAIKLGYLCTTGGYPIFLRPGLAPPPTPAVTLGPGDTLPTIPGGFELVRSSKVRTDVSVTGANAASTDDYSVGIWVHEPSWSVAVVRDIALWAGTRDEMGQRVIVGTWRGLPFHRRGTDLTTAILRGFKAKTP